MKRPIICIAAVGLTLCMIGGAPNTGMERPVNGVISASAAAISDSGICGWGVTWTLDDEGTLTISGTGDMYNYNYSNRSPFYDNSEIKTIIVEDGVKKIGSDAFFKCKSLISATVPDSVTSIGDSAFSSCTSLESINIGENNQNYKSIDGVLFDKSVTTLIQYPAGKASTLDTIPDSVTSIGDYAFESCTNLTSITIPDSVTSIGDSAFLSCESLTSITLSDSITSIGDHVFFHCTNLASVTIPDSVTSIGDSAFDSCTSLASITIPDSVTSIGDSAFASCTSLASIVIPDSVTSIGYSAFYGCTSLKSAAIPDSVTIINRDTFSYCTSLESINVDENNQNYKSVDGILFNKDMTELVRYPAGKTDTAYVIPDSVTSIGYAAFDSCTSLASVTVPDSVTFIYYAFASCTSLTSINIPDSITRISDNAFYNCTSLASITIPDSVTHIGHSALKQCISLTSITIPASVGSITQSAFESCTSLASITILDPDCEIYDSKTTICSGYDDDRNAYFDGTIYGYTDSTAQAYAEKYGYKFIAIDKPSGVSGDINNDGVLGVSDAVLLQKWLLAVPGTHLVNWEAADLNADGKLDVFDLALMKRALIQQQQ